MKQEAALKILREHKRELEEQYGVTRLGIFGSVARIERRFAGINSPDDFLDSDKGLDMLPKNGEPFRQDHMHSARST